MNDKPTYYGILPATVRYDKSLKPMARIMYAEITALSNKDGFCSAKNIYFANLYEVSTSTVSRWISSLSDGGYVRVTIIRDDKKNVIDRMIFPTDTPIDKKINRVLTKRSIAYAQKDQQPIDKKSKENTTSINTTSNNNPKGDFFLKEETLEQANKPNLIPLLVETLESKWFKKDHFKSLGETELGNEKKQMRRIAVLLGERQGISRPDTEPEKIAESLGLFLGSMTGSKFKWERGNLRSVYKLANSFTGLIEKIKTNNDEQAATNDNSHFKGETDFGTGLEEIYIQHGFDPTSGKPNKGNGEHAVYNQ
jgi:DNA-binding transcriptional ArsR family regulator